LELEPDQKLKEDGQAQEKDGDKKKNKTVFLRVGNRGEETEGTGVSGHLTPY